jgi:hypothetical protein
VTTFYDPMTPSHVALTRGEPASDTTRVGEAMAPAPGSKHSPVDEILVPVSRRFFARRAKNRLVVLVVLAACDTASAPSVGPPLGGPVPGALADPARDVSGAPGGATAFYQGLLADTLAGDIAGAAAGYERALADVTGEPNTAARAALRYAGLEAAGGETRRAIELLARAGALGEGDPVLTEQIERLQRALGLGAAKVEVRGPPLGTQVAGAEPAAAQRFERAEALLARAHRIRITPVTIERMSSVSSSIRVKESATEAAVRAYYEVAVDGPAVIAANYRIGSLYHELALALVFQLPEELDPSVAGRLRRSLRSNTIAYLRKAVAAYRRALDSGVGAEKWRAAAQTDLRGALDLLGEP